MCDVHSEGPYLHAIIFSAIMTAFKAAPRKQLVARHKYIDSFVVKNVAATNSTKTTSYFFVEVIGIGYLAREGSSTTSTPSASFKHERISSGEAGLFELQCYGFTMSPQRGNPHTCARQTHVGRRHNLSSFPNDFHLFFCVLIFLKDVDMGNNIIWEGMDEVLVLGFPLH